LGETVIEAVSLKLSNVEPLSLRRPSTPPYNLLGPFSEGSNGEPTGSDLNTFFPTSPITLALDSAADDLPLLPPLPDNQLDFARYEKGTRYSFDTSVRPLIQSRPDSPIGGTAAAPMAPKQPVNLGTTVIKSMDKAEVETRPLEPPACCDSKSDSNDAATENHPPPPCCEDEENSQRSKNWLEPRSDTSGSEAVGSENRPPMEAENQALAPVPAFPKKEKKVESKSRQVELKPKQRKPRTKHTSKNRSDGTENRHPTSSGELMVAAPQSPQIHSNDATSGGFVPGVAVIDFARSPRVAGEPELASVGPTSTNTPEIRVQPPSQDLTSMPLKDLGSSNLMKEAPKTNKVIPKAPTAGPRTTLSIPINATGELPSPRTPGTKQNGQPKRRTRYRLLDKGKRTMRKGRRIVLRRPVLVIALGRQLAGPTYDALKLISDGVPIDPSEVTANVKPPGGLSIPV